MYKNKAKQRVETKQKKNKKKTNGRKKPNKGNRGTVLLTVFWSLFSRQQAYICKNKYLPLFINTGFAGAKIPAKSSAFFNSIK